MKWCEHINQIGHKRYVFAAHSIHQTDVDQEFNFCPICGTPRPKEKTLEEKFFETFQESKFNYQCKCDDHYSHVKILVTIAKEHYKK